MHVACPFCNQALTVPDEMAGQVARCGQCGMMFTAPVPPWVAAQRAAAGPPSRAIQPDIGTRQADLSDRSAEPAAPDVSAEPVSGTAPELIAAVETPLEPVPTSGDRPILPPAPTTSSAAYATAPPPGGYPPAPPPSWQYVPYGATEAARAPTKTGAVGGLLLALGIVTLLWGGLMGLYVVLTGEGVFDEQIARRPEITHELFAAVFVVLGGLSLVSGAVELAAGIQVLRKHGRSRGLALAGAVLGLLSLWTCCLWFFALPASIYTLTHLPPRQ
jgi:hypothetical protein